MRPDAADIRLLIELYSDGELDAADMARAESVLESDASAREYLLALEEMKALVSLPIEDAAEQVSFDGLFDRVAARIDFAAAPERSAAMDALVVAYADGQLASAGEAERVRAYLGAHAEAREGVEALRELKELVRMPIEHASASVDFDALALRIRTAIDAEAAAVRFDASVQAARPGFWSRLVDFLGGRAVIASAVTAAAVVMIMLPFTSSRSDTDPVQIHNHYYEFSPAETVGYNWDSIEKGYEGTFRPGDGRDDLAPVIWIAPEGSTAWEKEPDTDPDAGLGSETSL